MSAAYYDANYLFKLQCHERGSLEVRTHAATVDVLTCALHGRAEFAPAAFRKVREGAATAAQYQDLLAQVHDEASAGHLEWLPLTDAVLDRVESVFATAPATTYLRAADAIHLATALKSAIASMYVEGGSTRRVSKIMEQMCGFEVSAGQVSNLNKQLDVEFDNWRNRPLPQIAFMTLDATYYKVRIDGVVRDCATLIAHGIRRDGGKRMILGVSCALSEAEVHWRGFLTGLKERGIGIPELVTSDAHSGLKAALKASLNGTAWQRCQFHLQQNAQEYVTTQDLKAKIASDIKVIFNADDRPHAEERLKDFLKTYAQSQPKLASWAEENLPEGFSVFAFPEAHRKRLRTSNACENVKGQIKQRTRVVGLFPSEESLLRLVTGVLIEISETWETGKADLLEN